MGDEGFVEFRYESDDGLSLAGRLYGAMSEKRLPLICLSGLTRNARDFHPFALAVRASANPRPVVAFDYRGRGRSDYAADAGSYNVPRETRDVLQGLDHLQISRAIFLGTSRGALVIHVLAVIRPDLIAAAIMNDAGPRLESEGLRLIRAYVGKSGEAAGWDSAAAGLAKIHGESFPALGREDFERMARANFVERNGRIVADYDLRIAETLAALDPDRAPPELWEQFAALKSVPVMVIRGEHSRLLSRETVDEMRRVHPGLVSFEAAGQGHAPLLETPDLAAAVIGFCERVDA